MTLVPLCSVHIELERPINIGRGPAGHRMIAGITGMTLSGDRLNASLVGSAAADWLTIVDGVATIDVRATVATAEGAHIYVQYTGRSDASAGMGSAPVYVSARFETSNVRYDWLNRVVAVGKGDMNEMRYEWAELR
ncbi:MAG: DUF3237 domain-containing protein [Ilumatobacter sp.]|uniref:DUF3237 domain-containing protein n=1 Tax=Ilumatobacter sp. TaxID=1967498 RepID=UPI00391ABEE5